MFKWIKKIEEVEEKLEKHTSKSFETVECETCGCLLKLGTAVKGEPKIVEKYLYANLKFVFWGEQMNDTMDYELKNTYYCKLHAPKRGKK